MTRSTRAGSDGADPATAEVRVPQYPIESVDNALKILLLLGERADVRLTEVAEYLGVASSTAHRLLAMLQYRGFVQQNGRTKIYGPGSALTGVAFAILRRFDFRSTIRPYLESLNVELQETVHLAILDGSTVRFVDSVESPRAVRVTSRLGVLMPANCTSVGKVMLAQMTPTEVRALFPNEGLESMTERSIQTRTALEVELAQVRKRGYAVSREESEAGVGSVAVAFPDTGSPARLALSVAAPLNRMATAKQVNLTVAALREAIAEASSKLVG